MLKIVILKLVYIEYFGDSIGDDLRIEIETQGNLININKQIAANSRKKINTEIAQFMADQTSLSLPINIKLIERDIIFNDVGSIRTNMKVDLSNSLPQRSVYEVKVKESRGISSDSIATFHVTMEAFVLQSTRYVAEINNGWLKVLLEDGAETALPTHLKVQLYRFDAKREYFTIMEGAFQGRKASVKRKPDGSSYLSTDNPHTDAIHAVYSISKKTLGLNGKTYITKDYLSAPWSKGIYDIEIPDAPHKGGLNYPDVRYAKTWFRVGHSGDRYIHTGSNSFGCITVTERSRWDEIYTVFIKARKGDSVSIGILKIID